MNNIMNIIANHFAMVSEAPEINPNPNIPENIAITRKIAAQINQPDCPLLFIFP
jgi:hypothetical protein